MMTLVFDGLIALIVIALAVQIIFVERRLRKVHTCLGSMQTLVTTFSSQVDRSDGLLKELRSTGETVGASLEQSMDACARQNRELRVLLAHCRRAEQRLKLAAADRSRVEARESASPPSRPAQTKPTTDKPMAATPIERPEDKQAKQALSGPIKWAPPVSLAPARPDISDLLASIRDYDWKTETDSPDAAASQAAEGRS